MIFLLPYVFQKYERALEESHSVSASDALKVKEYVRECVVLCWFMVVQDPPVVIASVARPRERFDNALYKAYTSSGTLIDFVVWPALLLHKGGPVLIKGTAQGSRRPATAPDRSTRASDISTRPNHERHVFIERHNELDTGMDHYRLSHAGITHFNGAQTFSTRHLSDRETASPRSYHQTTQSTKARSTYGYYRYN